MAVTGLTSMVPPHNNAAPSQFRVGGWVEKGRLAVGRSRGEARKRHGDRFPSTTPGAEPPRDAKDSGSARSHSTYLETSSSNRP